MRLVVGATGYLGGEICRRLVKEQQTVRALVRSTSDAAALDQLHSLGVALVEGDLKDPASLARACKDIDTVFSTATTTRTRQQGDTIESADGQGQLNLVKAARESGVDRFIYVSYSGQIGTDDPLTLAKRSVEQAVRSSGMHYTILRPSCFMEAWLSPTLGFDFINAKASIFGQGVNKISWISLQDVAAFAVESLFNPAALDAVLELGGPEALSPHEVVSIFEEVGGRPYELLHLPEEGLVQQIATAQDSLQKTFSALMLSIARGDAINMEKTLKLFPLKLTSVRDYASRSVGVMT